MRTLRSQLMVALVVASAGVGAHAADAAVPLAPPDAETAIANHLGVTAMNAAGDSIAVWTQAPPKAPSRLLSSRRGPSGGWSKPEVVATTTTPAVRLSTVGVQIAANGDATTEWTVGPSNRDTQERQGQMQFALAAEPRGASWQAAETIVLPTVESRLSEAAAAGTPDGAVTVAWCAPPVAPSQAGSAAVGQWTRDRGADGHWSAPVLVQRAGRCFGSLLVASDQVAGQVMAWSDSDQADIGRIAVVRRLSGGVWGTPRYIPGHGEFVVPSRLVFLPDGGAALLIDQLLLPSMGWVEVTEDGPLSPPAQVVVKPTGSTDPRVGMGFIYPAEVLVGLGSPSVVYAESATRVLDTEVFTWMGVGALWESYLDPTSERWLRRPVDALPETGDVLGSSAAQVDNRLLASWRSRIYPSCRTLDFVSVRTELGPWSRRMLVGADNQRPAESQACNPFGSPPSSGLDAQRAVVAKAASASSAGAPRVRLTSKSFADAFRHGSLSFTCRTHVAGYCTVSLVSGHRGAIRTMVDARCVEPLGTIRTVAHRPAVVRLSLSGQLGTALNGCRVLRRRLSHRTGASRIAVTVVADAVGRKSAGRRLALRIGR